MKSNPLDSLTLEQEEKLGARIVKELNLIPHHTMKDRYFLTSFGTKTNIGLVRTLARMFKEAAEN